MKLLFFHQISCLKGISMPFLFTFLFTGLSTISLNAQVSTNEVNNEVNDKLFDWIDGFWTNYRKDTAKTFDIAPLGGSNYKATGEFTFYRVEGLLASQVDYTGDFTVYFSLKSGDVSIYKLCVYKVYNEKECKSY